MFLRFPGPLAALPVSRHLLDVACDDINMLLAYKGPFSFSRWDEASMLGSLLEKGDPLNNCKDVLMKKPKEVGDFLTSQLHSCEGAMKVLESLSFPVE